MGVNDVLQIKVIVFHEHRRDKNSTDLILQNVRLTMLKYLFATRILFNKDF